MLYADYDLNTSYVDSCAPSARKNEFVVGLELEIENVHDRNHLSMEEMGIREVEDGSLRNCGYEFLTRPAVTDEAIAMFDAVHHGGLVEYGKGAFSSRTSIHVHVNCLYLKQQQVMNFLYLYAIFEDLAFAFCGNARKNNIHCVPLNATLMHQRYGSRLNNILDGWHKYTAFNLLPLRELGTVEFRHMEGHNSTPTLAAWLEFIKTLWVTARDMKNEWTTILLELSFLKEVEQKLLTTNFIKYSKEPICFNFENNLVDVKLGFI